MIQHIPHYLTEHPDAKDTMQGILQWWLPGNLVDWEEGAVQEALDELVARGWLTQRQTTPSQQLYGLNREKMEEIQTFLRERENTAEEQGE